MFRRCEKNDFSVNSPEAIALGAPGGGGRTPNLFTGSTGAKVSTTELLFVYLGIFSTSIPIILIAQFIWYMV